MLAPYPKTKPSGVEWLGRVPSHWSCARMANLVHHRPKQFNNSEETPVLSLTTRGIRVKKHLHVGKAAASYIGHQMVNVGELVFAVRDFDQTPLLSGVGYSSGCISNLYFVVAPKTGAKIEFVNRYLWGLKYKADYFRQFSEGMRYSFNRGSFNNIPALIPPIDEQEAIVRYLDDMDLQIRQFVQTKQKLIERLEEHRQALIARVVTRGLNPNVKFKESGVEWLGRVPAHWSCARMANLVHHRRKQFNESEETPVLSLTTRGIQVKEHLHVGKAAASYIGHQMVNLGELVFAVRDFDQTPLLSGVAYNRGCISNLYFVVAPKAEAKIEFVNLYLWGLKYKADYFRQFSEGMRYSFNRGSFNNIPALIPPANEQAEIVAYLNKATADIAAAVAQARQEIALVNEYRERLIADVVTGKLDARTAGAA